MKLLPLKLTPQQLKIAKLAAILKGYPYSVRGAIKLLADIGLDRFLKNVTQPQQTNTTPWYRIAHTKRRLYNTPQHGQSG